MVKRLLISPGRIIFSRPGFTASPSLADQNKLLDSDWDFSGAIIAAGYITDPAPQYDNNKFVTTTTTPLVITYPDPGYVPAAYVTYEFEGMQDNYFEYAEGAGPGGFHAREMWMRSSDDTPPVIGRSSITLHRSANGSRRWRYAGKIHYVVFSVTQ